MILAIDPGSAQSAWLLFDGRPTRFAIEPNPLVLDRFRGWHDMARVGEVPFLTVAVIEQVASYGMPVGEEVFTTVRWAGRFEEALHPLPVTLLPRMAVKMALCHSSRATDATIRQAILDRFGGKAAGVGTTKARGVLYGIKADLWSALALAMCYAEMWATP